MAQPLQGAMWKQLLQHSARDNLTLQGQIREMLVTVILDGQLKPEAPVPSSRELANELGVGRITVVLAYQQLADEGYLVSRERKGHFVSPALLGQRMQARAPAGDEQPAQGIGWSQRLHQHPSAQRSIVKPANWQQSPYPFLYGQFDESLFPTAAWRECCLKATRSPATTTRWWSKSAPACCPGAAFGPHPTSSSSPWARNTRFTWWPIC